MLICNYFPPDERVALCSLLDLPIPTDDEVHALQCTGHLRKRRNAAGRPASESTWSLSITALASTGYRLMLVTSGMIIDAAHIHQFADSRNNDVRNGLALCKNAHWLFDNGLWTITDDYTVRVAVGHFTEASPDQKRLSDYHGQ